MIELKGQDKFKGKVVHSSELDGLDLKGKRVAVIGAGASGVEAVELALNKGAKSISLLARSPHWVRWLVGGPSAAIET
jgi:cation diffusion facilitator CzcD-associated flavoprotein CzcO